ncbi:MAG: serine hydrolase domain-containing protein [Verrucomicrobiota bacterium]
MRPLFPLQLPIPILKPILLKFIVFAALVSVVNGQRVPVRGGLGVPIEQPARPSVVKVDPEDRIPVRILPQASPPPEFSAASLKEISAFWQGMMSDYQLPGAAIAIVQPDGAVLELCVGKRNIQQDAEIDADTIFNLGPSTLAFTTLLAATADRPDNPIFSRTAASVSPLFRMTDARAQRSCQISDLLTMTAGVPGYTDDIFDPQWARPEDVFALLGQAPVMSPPGSRYRHSQISATVGGYLTAMVIGNRNRSLYSNFIDVMQEQLIDPIGMKSATFSNQKAQATENTATGHVPAEFSYDPAYPEINERHPLTPLLGLKLSLNDAVRWLQTELMQGITPGGKRIASAVSVRERWQPATVQGSAHVGLGWSRQYHEETEIIMATGSEGRQTAAIGLYPGYRTGFVVLTNAESEDASRLIEAVSLGFAEVLKDSRHQAQSPAIAHESTEP